MDFWTPASCSYGQTILIKLIPLDKQSPSNLVPMDKWSPKIWSPYFQIITACPPGQTEYSRDHLSRGTKLVGDHLSRGTKFLGTICPWGLNLMGTGSPGIKWAQDQLRRSQLFNFQITIFYYPFFQMFVTGFKKTIFVT